MIQIVYGSGGGNTELVCQLLAENLLRKNKPVKLTRAKVNDFDSLELMDLYVFASPTYGHGQLEKYMEVFLASYDRCNFDIKDKKVAVIGLGDKKYDEDYRIESSKILTEFLQEKGAKLVTDPLEIGECVFNDLERKVSSFADEIVTNLK